MAITTFDKNHQKHVPDKQIHRFEFTGDSSLHLRYSQSIIMSELAAAVTD